MQAAADENIRVHVRVRPLNEQERQRGDQECIHIDMDGQTVRFVTPERAATGAPTVRALSFDSAIAGSSQADVFASTGAAQLLMDALDGYPVTIFAYGQTGSGKTYTMSGADDGAPEAGAVWYVR